MLLVEIRPEYRILDRTVEGESRILYTLELQEDVAIRRYPSSVLNRRAPVRMEMAMGER